MLRLKKKSKKKICFKLLIFKIIKQKNIFLFKMLNLSLKSLEFSIRLNH
jgi:hypothetical protein